MTINSTKKLIRYFVLCLKYILPTHRCYISPLIFVEDQRCWCQDHVAVGPILFGLLSSFEELRPFDWTLEEDCRL